MRRFRYLDALTTTFVVILLVSNLVAQKVVRIPLFTFHGHLLAFSTSGAMLLFPITYIFGDIFTEIYGYAASRRAIWLGFFGTALLYAVSAIVIALPSDPEFQHQQAFVTVFGILPRILIASLTAFWAGEFANSYTMAKLKLITTRPLAVDAHRRLNGRRPGSRHDAGHHHHLRRNLQRRASSFRSSGRATCSRSRTRCSQRR